MPLSMKITILTAPNEVAALSNYILSKPLVPVVKPQPDLLMAAYMERYVSGDKTVMPVMVEILYGDDMQLKKRLLYAINGIREHIDFNFQITEPELIQALGLQIKYKAVEWSLYQLLTSYQFEGYIAILKKWLLRRNASPIGAILQFLLYKGEYDCLGIIEKLSRRRRADLVHWPLILMALKTIHGYHMPAVLPYMEAITMQLYRRQLILMEGMQKDRMREYQYHYMHYLCLFGTAEVGPYIEEITPFLQKCYLAFYRFRMGIITDHEELYRSMERFNWFSHYREFAGNVCAYMTDEWKLRMVSHFLTGDLSNLYEFESFCCAICGPEFLKDHISLVADKTVANYFLKVHAMRHVPPEDILSDMLDAGLLKDIQRERALHLIGQAKREAPDAIIAAVMVPLPGGFELAHYRGDITYALYIQQHILRWAEACGPILDGVSVFVEEGEEGLVKVVFRDRGYIVDVPPGSEIDQEEMMKRLLNTLLAHADAKERLVTIAYRYGSKPVLGDEDALNALIAKYDHKRCDK